MGGWTESRKLLAAGICALPGPGPRTVECVFNRFPDPTEILDVPFERWLDAVRIPRQAGDLLLAAQEARVRTAAESAQRLFSRCAAAGIEITFRGEAAYPPRLAEVDPSPPLLFLRGPGARLRDRQRVALVGTRYTDAEGVLAARTIAGDLARSDVTIVSGAAVGIDTVCHDAALAAGGETWAFLGSSIDEIDASPGEVARRILAGGGTIFSELPFGVRADETTFPRRNRLISGSSDLTIVVRAPQVSGALLTAHDALRQKRPLMAVPGDTEKEVARGSNGLLRSGKAKACWGAASVFAALGNNPTLVVAAPKKPAGPARPPKDAREARVLELLGGRAVDFDTLLAECGLTSGELSATLTALEIDEVVREVAGRRYCLR